MEIKNIKKDDKKNVTVTIRTFGSYSKWMKKNNISPTKVFNEAVKELMKPNESSD